MSAAAAFHALDKAFGPVQVLHGVSFDLAAGRVYGLLGENGAGKSTLMKILAGYERADRGELQVGGRSRRYAGPREAEADGVVMIHQEFNLAEDLTIAQNIHLGHEPRHGWRLDEARMRREAAAALRQVGLERDPATPVRELIVAEKQLVEIARALAREARLLIMDEPTAALTPAEAERLFGLIARLRAGGATVVYVSHKLEEIERITDEVILMRDGRYVGRHPTAGLTRREMARLMVGRSLSDLFPPKQPPPAQAQPLLRVRGLDVPGWVEGAGFEVRAGEILGFAGLVGAGRTELFEGLLGLRPARYAEAEVDGRPLRPGRPRAAVRQGLVYLSEDRKGKGLHLDLGLAQNLTLMALRRYARPWLRVAQERRALRRAADEFGIRAGDPGQRAGALSGGNQQKLALAKVLHTAPRVLVLDEPTRGVDIGAKRDIYHLIHALAAEGRGIVVVSSELPELIGLCHRVAVMRRGRLQAVLEAPSLTEEALIAHATGAH